MNDHEIARSLAVQAGELLSNLRKNSVALDSADTEEQITTGQRILGDEGDYAGNMFLVNSLKKLCPNDAILSEEESADAVSSTTDERRANQRVWIIDPLDGTSEYSSGRDDYAVHVALWDAHCTGVSGIVAASVAVPDRGEVWSMDDAPGPSPDNSRPIRIMVSRSRPPAEVEVISRNLQAAYPGRGVDIVPMGSVGAKVGYMLSGQADMYINTGGFYEWDLAAPLGVAVHRGFIVCDVQGREIPLNQVNTKLASAIMCRPEFESIVMKSLA